MTRQIRRHGRVHSGADAEALLHPAVKEKAYLPKDEEAAALAGIEAAERAAAGGAPSDPRQFVDAEDIAVSRGGGSGNPMDAMAYDHGTGEGATPIVDRATAILDRDHARREKLGNQPHYQRSGRDKLAGYANNPLEDSGRAQIGRQFLQAPLGGHVRHALEGQEIFGHRITGTQALYGERGLAGLAAVGVGVPAFLAAVNQLSTPQTSETIPM